MKKQTLRRLMTWAVALLLPVMSLQAMSYDEARDRAWFLTDKMAHELSLTQEQYEKAYQINLDYLISIETASDCLGRYWTYRNADFECILLPWQYALYVTLEYFFRPVRWLNAAWYFPVFEHYRPGVFYFSRPAVYVSYVARGWRSRGHNDPSPYRNFRPSGVKTPTATDKSSRNPGYHFVPIRQQQSQTVSKPSTSRPANQNNTTRPTQKNNGQTSTQKKQQEQGNKGRQFGTTQRTGGTQKNSGQKNSSTQQTRPTQKNSGQQSTQKTQQEQGNKGRQFGTTQRTGGTQKNSGQKNSSTQQTRPTQKNSGQQSTQNKGKQSSTTRRTGSTQQSVKKTTNQSTTKSAAGRKTTTRTK